MKIVLSIALLLIPLWLQADAQAVPGDNFLPGWVRSGPARTFIQADLFNYIDGGAELFLEFGFSRLSVQKYARSTRELTLEIYEMSSPTSALAIYLQRKGKETRVPEIALRNSGDAYQVKAIKGRYFVQVSNAAGQPSELPAIAGLISQSASALKEETEASPLDRLPPGSIPGSEQLIHGPYSLQNLFTFGEGDILSLAGHRWAAAADYPDGDKGAYTRIVVDYGDPDAARAAFTHLVANLDSYLTPLARTDSRLEFRDYQKRFGIIELRDGVLDIRIGMRKML